MVALGACGSLLAAYQDLPGAEARLGEVLAQRGVRVGASVVDQWPVLADYLNLYARDLSPAGLLVLGGGPDEGSRVTGIPFTGAAEARATLGLDARGAGSSPSAAAFWRAVSQARAERAGAPLESLFGTVHLALARPFDAPSASPEVREASAGHVRRLLAQARPQAALAVGAEALATLGHAVGDPWLADLARAPEPSWLARWPPGTPLWRCPAVDVPGERPFRLRVVPVPSLVGESADAAALAVGRALACAWA